jgi:hypothetical protein
MSSPDLSQLLKSLQRPFVVVGWGHRTAVAPEADAAILAVIADYGGEVALDRMAFVPLPTPGAQATLHGALDYIAHHQFPGTRFVISPPMYEQSWNGRLAPGVWTTVNAITRTGRRPKPKPAPEPES